jgi:hypothetical protein
VFLQACSQIFHLGAFSSNNFFASMPSKLSLGCLFLSKCVRASMPSMLFPWVSFPLSVFLQACHQSFHMGMFSSKLCSCKHALKAFTSVSFHLNCVLASMQSKLSLGCVFSSMCCCKHALKTFTWVQWSYSKV